MVCVERKAQLLARRGMDMETILPGAAFSPVLTKAAKIPQPGTAQRVDVLIPTAVLHVMQAVLNAPVVAE